MPLVRSIGGDVDDIISVLPKSLWCQAYHGGTDNSGYGEGNIGSMTMTFDGTLSYSVSVTKSNDYGYGGFSVTKNGTSAGGTSGSGSGTVDFVEGDVLALRVHSSGLESWARVTTSASLTWTAT